MLSHRTDFPLGEVLTRRSEAIDVADDVTYQQVTVRIKARGLALRGSQSGSEIGTKRQYVVRAGDFMVSKIDARNGAFGLVPRALDGAIVTQDFPVFSIDPTKCLPRYLELISGIPSFWDECLLASEGTTNRVRLNIDEFLTIVVSLPSIPEQHAIVRVVQRVDVARIRAERSAQAARRLLKSMQVALIDENEADREPLHEFTKVVTGGTPSRDKPSYFEGDIPWLKSGDIVFSEIHDGSEHITKEAIKNSAAKLLPAGTVVIAMYGQGATRGRSGILRKEMATNQACAGILPSDQLDERFTFHWLWSAYESLREEYEGTTQPNLSKGLIEQLEIPRPPLQEQREIADQLERVRLALEAAIAEEENLRKLRAALTESLVAGDAVVTENPDIPEPELLTVGA